MSEQFKTNTTRIAQLCYYDDIIGSWVPVTSSSPIPIKIVDVSGDQVIPTVPTDTQLVGGLHQSYDTVATPLRVNLSGELKQEDFDVGRMLTLILKELQKINMHLECITSEYFDNSDIEVN